MKGEGSEGMVFAEIFLVAKTPRLHYGHESFGRGFFVCDGRRACCTRAVQGM